MPTARCFRYLVYCFNSCVCTIFEVSLLRPVPGKLRVSDNVGSVAPFKPFHVNEKNPGSVLVYPFQNHTAIPAAAEKRANNFRGLIFAHTRWGIINVQHWASWPETRSLNNDAINSYCKQLARQHSCEKNFVQGRRHGPQCKTLPLSLIVMQK